MRLPVCAQAGPGDVSSDTLASTAEYLGHEGAEVARAAELWQRIARYEANHPVSLKVHGARNGWPPPATQRHSWRAAARSAELLGQPMRDVVAFMQAYSSSMNKGAFSSWKWGHPARPRHAVSHVLHRKYALLACNGGAAKP